MPWNLSGTNFPELSHGNGPKASERSASAVAASSGAGSTVAFFDEGTAPEGSLTPCESVTTRAISHRLSLTRGHRLPVWPHRGVASFEVGDSRLGAVCQAHHEELPDALTLGAIGDRLAVGRGLRVVMEDTVRGFRELRALAIECRLEQLDALADVRGIEDRRAIRGPDRRIAAALVAWPGGRVNGMSVSADGQRLLTSGADGTVGASA